MAYVRALSELEIQTRVVYFSPDKAHSRVRNSYHHVDFVYMWDRWYIDIPRLRKISLKLYLRRFVQRLKSGDIVYVYGFPDLVVALSKRNDIKIFAERTEFDGVSFICHVKKITINQFIEACRIIDGVVVISQGLRKYYIESGCQANRVHIINMIADTTRFTDLQKQQKEPYIAYCGTALNNKDGVDQLIRAFSIVNKSHPNYKLYIIGSTPSKQQRFYNYDLVQELGIEKNVVFTGIVPSTDIPQLLKNASILALDRPNNLQAKYGFPTKLGEYLLTANPVVITCVGDIPLFLKDGESALVSEPDDPQSFAEKLCWAIEHPHKAEEIGKKGKQVAELCFNYMTETRKLINIINRNRL